MNTIIINGVEYIRKDTVSVQLGSKRIVVTDRGWVFVGDCVDNDDKSVTIHNAKNIRRWGTEKGLGQLTTGPTENTVADDYGTVKCTPIVSINVISGW